MQRAPSLPRRRQQLVRAIGVSNFTASHLQQLIEAACNSRGEVYNRSIMWDINLCLYLISTGSIYIYIYIYIYVLDIWVCLQMGISMKPSDFNHQEWRFDQWMRMALSTGNQPVFWDPQDGIDMLPMVNQIEAGQEQERPRNFRCLMMSHAHFLKDLKVRPWVFFARHQSTTCLRRIIFTVHVYIHRIVHIYSTCRC